MERLLAEALAQTISSALAEPPLEMNKPSYLLCPL
jgi:hypothetical protein